MFLSRNKAREVREYIQKLFSLQSEEDFLRTALPEAARILNIDYHAFILFPNVFSQELLCESNNPENFTREYTSHLMRYDPLMNRMIQRGNRTTTASQAAKLEERRKSFFFNECDALRPAADGVYIPLIVDNMLVGFTGMVRAKDNAQPLSREELTLLEFLISFIPATIDQVLEIKGPDSRTALLDYNGEVLSCGDVMMRNIQSIIGSAEGRITQAMLRVLKNPTSVQTVDGTEISGEKAQLRLRLIHPRRIRRYFPKRPQFELTIHKKHGLPFKPELINSYGLTEREVEIVGELYRGNSNESIANNLGISLGTVKQHIYNIYNKTGVDSRVRLILKLSI